MTNRPLSAFVEALAAGRRPKPYKAKPEDIEVLQAAIALRGLRPGDAAPDEQFVIDLHQRLSEQGDPSSAPNVHPIGARRIRTALVAVAASAALIGGTFAATEQFVHSTVTTAAVQVPHENELRTGTFETAHGGVLGQIVAYRGHPAWVYMDVGVSQSRGTVTCRLQLDNGSIVAAGTIEIHRGKGQLAKTVRVDISRLRGAQLFTSTGNVLASATFA
jgi:hypothetical protein